MENKGKNIVAKQAENVNTFEQRKRKFESAYTSGGDYSAELLDLSQAVAMSTLRKVLDPRRNGDDNGNGKPSDSGQNPALLALRREVVADRKLLDNTRRTADGATRIAYNDNGDARTETAEKNDAAALAELTRQTLGDGIDLVQAAALAILEQAAEHAAGGGEWLEKPYTVRRLSRRVYIRRDDSAAYTDTETTPIQEVYRAVRAEIEQSRAVRTDPRNGYSYLEEIAPDGLEMVYRRLKKWADVGGYAHGGPELYTADSDTVDGMESTLSALKLSARQTSIVWLRLQGYGHKAIARYLGITADSVKTQFARIKDKCAAVGFTPSMWAEMVQGATDSDN